MKSKFILVLTILFCATISTVALSQEMKVGTLLPQTGALKDWGPAQQKAAQLAAQQINAAGLKMDLVSEDSETSAAPAIKAAKKLVEQDKVLAIVGAVSSGVTIPVAETVTIPKEVFMISPGSTSPEITYLPANKGKDFLFRTCPSDTLQGVALGMLASDLYRTASVMYVDNPYGRGLAQQFKRSFERRGGKVLALVPHPEKVAESYKAKLRDALDQLPQREPYVPGRPDVLCVFSYPGHAGIYVKEAVEHFKFKNFLFCDGSKSESIAYAAGIQNVEGSMGTAPGTAGGEPYANFIADYKRAFGEVPSVPFLANAYDATAAIGLAAYAAKLKGLPLTSANIRDQLRTVSNPPGVLVGPGEFAKAFQLLSLKEDINYQGASGSVDFDQHGDVVAPIEIWKFSAGRIVTYRMEYQIPAE